MVQTGTEKKQLDLVLQTVIVFSISNFICIHATYIVEKHNQSDPEKANN